MKALAIFALLLLPTHTTPNKNQHTYHEQSNSSDSRSPTSTYVNNEPSYRENDEGKNKTPPPWANPEWWLCGVGIVTLWFIWLQAHATAIAARASLESIQAVMNTERGFLLVDWDDLICLDEPPTEVNEWKLSLPWNVRNTGKSPVFLVETCCKFIMLAEMSDLNEEPLYPPPIPARDEPVTTDKKSESFIVTMETDIPFGEVETIYKSRKGILYVYGYVKYLDIFKREHYTRFGLRYFAYPDPKREYDKFRIGGPNKYNEYT
jgi:hypothetical protein